MLAEKYYEAEDVFDCVLSISIGRDRSDGIRESEEREIESCLYCPALPKIDGMPDNVAVRKFLNFLKQSAPLLTAAVIDNDYRDIFRPAQFCCKCQKVHIGFVRRDDDAHSNSTKRGGAEGQQMLDLGGQFHFRVLMDYPDARNFATLCSKVCGIARSPVCESESLHPRTARRTRRVKRLPNLLRSGMLAAKQRTPSTNASGVL